jgi:hypothetical protein
VIDSPFQVPQVAVAQVADVQLGKGLSSPDGATVVGLEDQYTLAGDQGLSLCLLSLELADVQMMEEPAPIQQRSVPLSLFSRFLQPLPERLVEKASLVQGAKLLEQRPGHREGQDVRRQVLPHGNVRRAGDGLRDVQVVE